MRIQLHNANSKQSLIQLSGLSRSTCIHCIASLTDLCTHCIASLTDLSSKNTRDYQYSTTALHCKPN
uniref:Uncharacterized protein n=1 Tax=Arundo donax TaxID=35708 RepID=A0A0A9GE52_ARUDO